MRKRAIILVLTASLCGSPLLAGQKRGQKPAQSQGKGRVAPVQQGGQKKGGYQKESGAQESRRIQISQQQRDQLNNCTQASERIRQQARTMSKTGKGGAWNTADAKRQRDQLRTHVEEMTRQHGRLMQGLNDAQRLQVQSRRQEMDQTRTRLQSRLRAVDQELEKENPNPKTFRKQVRKLEKETKKLQKQYRKLGEQFSVPSQ